MSIRSRMTMRAVVQRNTSATDDWGQPGVAGWTTVATVPCYATVHTAQELVGSGNADQAGAMIVVLTDMHVYMPEGTDITPADRILQITDRKGVVLFPGPIDVKHVDLRPRQHLDLTVKAAA